MADTQRKCQETLDMIGDQYVRCGSPAVGVVQHRGRTEGPYAMCLEHLDHNARNRNAAVIEWFDGPVPARYKRT